MTRDDLTKLGQLGLTALVAFGMVACGDDPPPETPPQPTATAPPPAPVPTTPPVPAPVEPTVQTGPCNAAEQVAMQQAIQAREKAELSSGMKAEGAFTCMHVAQGEVVSVPVTLQQGRCYTVLAHSQGNVTELNAFLKPNLGPNPAPLLLPFANVVFSQDSETGPTASLNSGQNCFKNPAPIPVAAVAEAQSAAGNGMVAVQVYAR